MTLSRRLGRMEAAFNPAPLIEIIAGDEAEADTAFEAAILGCDPGPVCIAMTIGGVRTEWRDTLLAHEDRLALMDGEGQ